MRSAFARLVIVWLIASPVLSQAGERGGSTSRPVYVPPARPLQRTAPLVDQRDWPQLQRKILWLGGCTGFIVQPRFLVTARHCGERPTVDVTIDGRRVTARLAAVGHGEDGPLVYLLPPGDWPGFPLADGPPKAGDAVWTAGYPAGRWAYAEGVIRGGNGRDANFAAMRINPGHSGGPLLNARGEVVGVATGVATQLGVNESVWVGWRVTADAVRRAAAAAQTPRSPPAAPDAAQQADQTEIVVFASHDCPPCLRLYRDVQNGAFPGYRFRFVWWDGKLGVWSDPDLLREFLRTAHPPTGELATPTIWIRGTTHYRVGYAGRPGLLDWLAAALRKILRPIVGGPAPPSWQVPEPSRPETPPQAEHDETPPPQPEPKKPDGPQPYQRPGADLAELKRLREQIARLAEDLKQAKQTVDQFQSAGVIGKVRRIDDLLALKTRLANDVGELKSELKRVRDDVTVDPRAVFWGLLGVASGLLRRRIEQWAA